MKRPIQLRSLMVNDRRATAPVVLEDGSDNGIAIIGMAAQLPGASDLDEFWETLLAGREHVDELPAGRKADIESYLRFLGEEIENIRYLRGAYLREIDTFDHAFFGIPPKEASLMNPMHRLFLQTAWSAFEDAGYTRRKLHGSRTGIYVGLINDRESYKYQEMIAALDESLLPLSAGGNILSMIPGRISYTFNLKGPSLVVDTACSSSLVALDLACKGLRNGECDMALVGGVRLMLLPIDRASEKIGFESPEERTRAFDEGADGSGVGEGVIALLLKPLSKALRDGDRIHAVLKGIASNQDGTSMGITAPNPDAQADLLVAAWKDAGVDPNTIAYIEAHGTGTRLGDPIELEGITTAFRRFTDRRQFCALGSVKANLGHLYACAGLAGVVKAVLALRHRQIPAQINFARPNREIDFVESPVYVNTRVSPWEAGCVPRRCGVSSFGLSGTNCHAVLEEAPVVAASGDRAEGPCALVLSARSDSALRRLVGRYRGWLEAYPGLDIRDVCYTAGVGREHHAWRLAIIATDLVDLVHKLAALEALPDPSAADWPWLHVGLPAVRGVALGAPHLPAEDPAALVREYARRVRETGRTDAGLLDRICALYVSGADIDWEEFFRGQGLRKVSLPNHPLEPVRCWLEFPAPDVAVDGQPTRTRPATEPEGGLRGLQFFTMKWQRADATAPAADGERRGAVLLLAGDAESARDVARVLRDNGRDVVVAVISGPFAGHCSGPWQVTGSEADYERLFRAIQHRGVSDIVHLPSGRNRVDLAGLPDDEEAVLGLFRLIRALGAGGLGREVGLTVVVRSAETVVETDSVCHPHYAAMKGLLEVARKELPWLQCRWLDLDEATSLDAIAVEMSRGFSDRRVAYRQGLRYVEAFDLVDRNLLRGSEPPISDSGVYVITGGLGGIGLELARYLVSRNSRARIALVGRSGLPPREHWAELMATGSAKVRRAVAAIREMESCGADICVMALDVANRQQMAEGLEQLRRRYGRINGVIHAAGIGHAVPLMEGAEVEFRSVLLPKIMGTRVLDELTRQDRPDFFVLCSSVASLFSAAGQGGYAAANAFLDAYAAYRSAAGLPTLAINWTTWKETGMAADQGWAIDTIFKTLPTAVAIEGFRSVLGRPIQRVVIGELNLDGGISLLQASGVPLSEALALAVERVRADRTLRPSIPQKSTETGAIALTGRDRAHYPATERLVAAACQEFLGYREIDVHQNFFEMGADSIVLTRIAKRLEERFPGKVPVTKLFEYATVAKLAAYLAADGEGPVAETRRARRSGRTASAGDIAIIGIGIKLPGANSLDEFWANIAGGVNSVTRFPAQRREEIDRYLRFTGLLAHRTAYLDGAYLEDVHNFDYNFFRIPPREAVFIDPHQRLLLQTAWHAIEDAGYGGGKLAGSDTGVFVGLSTVVRDMYAKILYDLDPTGYSNAIVGNAVAVVAGRISYMLDLRGPSMVLDTACSSGLVALDTACQAIRAGRCSMALVGGIKLSLVPAILDGKITGIGMDSGDGLTRTFDEYADGTAFGEGVQVILIKPLERAVADGDHIYAVIKGSAVNQDGSSAGITAPNPEAQLEVLLRSWEEAGIDPSTLGYIEAHGTGTQLGDPIELSSLQNAFRKVTDKKHFCAVGSVKTNLGHLAEGAGLVGLIKCVLAMKHGQIPASLHFNRPNPKIDLIDSPVYVNTRLRRWERGAEPRRCAVSAFGMSGTNSHVVLEEYIEPAVEADATEGPHIFVLSARTRGALDRLVADYSAFLERHGNLRLRDVCYTASTGRGHYQYRLAVVADDLVDLRVKLDRLGRSPAGQEDAPDIFYGVHRIVPADREFRAPEDLSEEERHELTDAARDRIERLQAGEVADRQLLAEICSLYVKGADIPWEQLYAGGTARRVSLPVYPFEPTRCWVDFPSGDHSDVALDTLFYTVNWRPEPAAGEARRLSGTAVVLTGSGSELGSQVVQRLRADGIDVVEVRTGEQYERVEGLLFTVSGEEDDYARLFGELADRRITLVLHMGALASTTAAGTASELDVRLREGVYGAVSLTRVLANLPGPVDLCFVAPHVHEVTGTEQRIVPEHGALFGLAKSIGLEYRHLRCRAIDVDDATTAEDLLRELRTPEEAFVTAYRNGVRYVEEFSEVDIQTVPERNLSVREGGVYVITGGLGGIGTVMARHLAAQAPVRLVLINRSPLPDRAEWDAFLAAYPDDKLAQRIKTIRELESSGATVAYYAADVSDPDAMAGVLADVRRRFGRIDGVIHGAGIANPGMLIRKPQQRLAEVLDAKVRGAWLLDHLTDEDEPDFFILFSSAVTLIGEAGQADYVAANYYLDCYAAHRNRRRKNTLVIDWVSWADAGMAVAFQINVDTLFKALPSGQAVSALQTLLSRSLTRAIVGQFNADAPPDVLASAWAIPCRLSDRITAVLQNLTRGSERPAVDRADTFVPLSTRKRMSRSTAPHEVRLDGRETDEYSDLERKIAQIFGAELGFSDIDIYESFFALGGDSIMLSRVHQALEKEFPGAIKLVELFEYTSVARLAQYLRSKLDGQAPSARQTGGELLERELKLILDRVQEGEMSIDEALRLLEGVED